MTRLLDKINQRGFWYLNVRPAHFLEARIGDFGELLPILQRSVVRMRGWDYPHVDARNEVARYEDFISQESEIQQYLESWRLYTSGMFVDYSAMSSDWRDQSTLWPPNDDNWRWGFELGATRAVFRYVEMLEFATKLALSPAGASSVRIEIVAHGLNARRLLFDPKRGGLSNMSTEASSVAWIKLLDRDDLVANRRSYSTDAALHLFSRFGWDPDSGLIRDIQEELYELGKTV